MEFWRDLLRVCELVVFQKVGPLPLMDKKSPEESGLCGLFKIVRRYLKIPFDQLLIHGQLSLR
jgi:hypothetical protein